MFTLSAWSRRRNYKQLSSVNTSRSLSKWNQINVQTQFRGSMILLRKIKTLELSSKNSIYVSVKDGLAHFESPWKLSAWSEHAKGFPCKDMSYNPIWDSNFPFFLPFSPTEWTSSSTTVLFSTPLQNCEPIFSSTENKRSWLSPTIKLPKLLDKLDILVPLISSAYNNLHWNNNISAFASLFCNVGGMLV